MEFDTNNHSVFMLNYHLIMCVKYRNNVIDDAISLRLKEIFKNICLNYNISLEEWNHDKDHVHVLFRGQPNSEISKFIIIHYYHLNSFTLVILYLNYIPYHHMNLQISKHIIPLT